MEANKSLVERDRSKRDEVAYGLRPVQCHNE